MNSDNQVLLHKNVDFFDVDVFGNYVVVSNNKISIHSPDNSISHSFEDNIYGQIANINADNAMNIMVYYSEFQKVLFFDNTLSPKRSAIDLNSLGYSQITNICLSYNTGFWIYDPSTFSLKRFNRLLQETHSSGNLNQILGISISPYSIKEENNLLVLNDTNNGIFIFDRYGTFQKKVPFQKINDFQIVDESLNLLRNDSIFSYNIKSLQIDTIPLNITGLKKFKFASNNFYYLTKNMEFYKMPLKN